MKQIRYDEEEIRYYREQRKENVYFGIIFALVGIFFFVAFFVANCR